MKLTVVSQNVCSGCRQLESYLGSEYPDLEYNHVNIDNEPVYIEKYGIMSTPTTIVEDGDEEVVRMTGFNTSVVDSLEAIIDMID